MSERSVRKGDRFRWWNSERSGFQFGFKPLTSAPNEYSREDGRPVRDKGIEVAPDEYDTPPPSTRPLGGEGEIGTGARTNSTVLESSLSVDVQYLTSTSIISWNYDNVPIYISGSNSAITLGTSPLAIGPNGTYISIWCVDSSVTINSGNGITFDFRNRPSIRMTSGSIITLISNATDSTWHITSFNPNGSF